MADSSTTHLNLIKQDVNAAPDFSKENDNLDTLDAEVWARGKTFNGEYVGEDGGFHIRTVPYAENLETGAAQKSNDSYIDRTTGGDASIQDGDAWLMLIQGRNTHTGYIAPLIDMTVTPMPREEGEDTITATINEDTFFGAVSSTSGTISLTYSTGWSANPATYGITVSGTPVAGDAISVVYQKEVRGTIYVSTPSAFVATGWNLYNHTNQRARVLKYSDEYNFKISGTYSTLQFATTIDGARTTITPVNGAFSIPADGYLFVTGGNNTNTAIWMTWSDWTQGYAWDSRTGTQGDFAAYSETTIDLSGVIGSGHDFPYGLLSAGTVHDEINFNVGVATSYVERLAYDSTNLATAKSSGRQYEYDTNYIYLERSTPITSSVSIDGSYTVSDHGMESFSGTSQAVYAQTIYGANLKNKLERDVLTISQQTLSAAQKGQVQENLGLTPTESTSIATSGYVADARVVKTLNDKITTQTIDTGITGVTAYKNGNLVTIIGTGLSVSVNAGSYTKIIDVPNNKGLRTALSPVSYGICVETNTRKVGYVFYNSHKLYASCAEAITVSAFSITYPV